MVFKGFFNVLQKISRGLLCFFGSGFSKEFDYKVYDKVLYEQRSRQA